MTEPNQKIIATWHDRDKRVLYAAFGLKFPKHPKNADPYLKIKDFKAEDFPALMETIYVNQRVIGVNNLIGDAEMDILVNYLGDEFPDFNVIEITCALMMASAGHLNIAERDLQHYQSISPKFLNTILSSYRQYRLKIMARHDNEFADSEAVNNAKPAAAPTAAQLFETNKRLCLNNFDAFLVDGPLMYLDKVYDFLRDQKIYVANNAERHKFEEKAKDNLKLRAKKEAAVADILKSFNHGDGRGINAVITEAKKLAVMAFFTKHQANPNGFLQLF